MSRPEHSAPPELFYNATEAKKYTQSSRIVHIQNTMAQRAIELLALPEGVSLLLADIGCGSVRACSVPRTTDWARSDFSPPRACRALAVRFWRGKATRGLAATLVQTCSRSPASVTMKGTCSPSIWGRVCPSGALPSCTAVVHLLTAALLQPGLPRWRNKHLSHPMALQRRQKVPRTPEAAEQILFILIPRVGPGCESSAAILP